MGETKAFIPKDKPRLWVIAILAGLAGLLSGLLAFGAAWLGLSLIKGLFIAVFFICWVTFAVSWVGFMIGMLSGRYHGLEEKPWRDQVW